MPTIVYTEHLKHRLNIREIPEYFPSLIFQAPDQCYFDPVEDKKIAIKDLWYHGKMRPMMIAYEEKGDLVEIVTIHPMSKEKILNRVERKRWVSYE